MNPKNNLIKNLQLIKFKRLKIILMDKRFGSGKRFLDNPHISLKRNKPQDVFDFCMFKPLKRIKPNDPKDYEKNFLDIQKLNAMKMSKKKTVSISEINYLFDKNEVLKASRSRQQDKNIVEANYSKEKKILREAYFRKRFLSQQ